MLSFKTLMRVLALPILSQLVLTTTSCFLVVNFSEKNLGFLGSLFQYDSNDISFYLVNLFSWRSFGVLYQNHILWFLWLMVEKRFFLEFSLVWSVLSLKPLMSSLAPPILSQLVLTTTSCFFVVNPSEKSLGFSDSLFHYDFNDILFVLVDPFPWRAFRVLDQNHIPWFLWLMVKKKKSWIFISLVRAFV